MAKQYSADRVVQLHGTLALKSDDGSVIKTTRYNNGQIGNVNRDRAGNETYNEAGALDYLKKEKSRWEASDQFVGELLKIEEL